MYHSNGFENIFILVKHINILLCHWMA